MTQPIVWAADVGSVKAGNFAWARGESAVDDIETGVSIEDFASGIADDLSQSRAVAVGFECPLFIPVNSDPLRLTSARVGERAAYSAGGGSGALVTGLSQTVWVLEKVQHLVRRGTHGTTSVRPTLRPPELIDGTANLLLWEAFVTGAAKGAAATGSHEKDARTAVATFLKAWPNLEAHNAVTADNPYSLVGAAILRSGCSTEISLLRQACVVLASTSHDVVD